MPDLTAWAAELVDARAALLAQNLILADHLLTNVQLKIRAARAAQLIEAAQARKTVLPMADPPKRRGAGRGPVNSNQAKHARAARKRSVIDQLCEEE